MDKEIQKILESIEMDEKELFDIRQRLLTATTGDAKQIIDLMSARKGSHFVGHDWFSGQPYYYLFEAYAYELLHKHGEAIDRASRAASLFHMRNHPWNEAMLHWFISLIERGRRREEEACKEAHIATAILEGIAKGFQRDGRRGDCQDCQELLRELYRQVSLSKPFEEITVQNDTDQHLCLSTIPLYNSVILKEIDIDDEKNKKAKNRDAKNGDKTKDNEQDKGKTITYEWDESLENPYIKIPLVMIGDNWFIVKSVKAAVSIIKLEKGKEYGWVKVPENATDLMKPLGLNSEDYVLFSKQHEAAENDIVIVAWQNDDLHKQPSYSIRKLNKEFPHMNSLIPGDPVPLSDHTQIMGVVIATGKRFLTVPDKELGDDKLYGFLLKKVNGDKKKVADLFIAEQKRNPYARKSQVLKNAILRWELTH